MDFSLVYLANRFIYRVGDFFHHWYMDGSRAIGRKFLTVLSDLDRTFALRVTLKHFFQPLYKDYSAMGRILGIIFRTGRVIVAAVIYLVVILIGALIYIAWLAVPVIILFYAIHG